MKKILLVAAILMLTPLILEAADGSDTSMPINTQQTPPDNTKINHRDRHEQTVTPLDQSNSRSDLDITKQIRKSLMQYPFSTDAKNIKIITQNGDVTLRGPVKNTTELNKIVELTKSVPGIKTLNNELQIP